MTAIETRQDIVTAYRNGDDEIRDAEGRILLERLPDGAVSVWRIHGAWEVSKLLVADGYRCTEMTERAVRWERPS